MKESTLEYAIKAIDSRIKKLNELIQWQQNLYNDHSKALKTRSHQVDYSSGFGVVTEFYEDTSTKIVRESKEKLDKFIPLLEKYKDAREDLISMQ